MKFGMALSVLIFEFFGSLSVASADSVTFAYTTIDVPGSDLTTASDINNASQIVGDFGSSTGQHGFLYNKGAFSNIDVPGSTRTVARGINDDGEIVGEFDFSGETSGPHGFVDRHGIFNTVDVPGSDATTAAAISDTGWIVGTSYVFLCQTAPACHMGSWT